MEGRSRPAVDRIFHGMVLALATKASAANVLQHPPAVFHQHSPVGSCPGASHHSPGPCDGESAGRVSHLKVRRTNEHVELEADCTHSTRTPQRLQSSSVFPGFSAACKHSRHPLVA